MFRSSKDEEEAAAVTNVVIEWVGEAVSAREIAVLARQQPHLFTSVLVRHLTAAGIGHRNEQQTRELAPEPVAALVLNILRSTAHDGRSEAHSELVRVVTRGGTEEAGGALGSELQTMLREAGVTGRAVGFSVSERHSWKALIGSFLELVGLPALNVLSPSYQQGSRLRTSSATSLTRLSARSARMATLSLL